MDGGRQDGQELVVKITFIQRGTAGCTKSTGAGGSSGWLAEVTELDNVGDGYYGMQNIPVVNDASPYYTI